MCPLFRGSTVHKEEDNLFIVDKMAGPNVYSEVPLYIVDKMTGHNVSFIQGSTVHKEEDNLSIVDKMAGPKVPLYIRKRTTSL